MNRRYWGNSGKEIQKHLNRFFTRQYTQTGCMFSFSVALYQYDGTSVPYVMLYRCPPLYVLCTYPTSYIPYFHVLAFCQVDDSSIPDSYCAQIKNIGSRKRHLSNLLRWKQYLRMYAMFLTSGGSWYF